MGQPKEETFRAVGIVTLTSDFGTSGPYMGVLHGVMLGQLPTARIVNLVHDVEVHWPAEAGFWIERAYKSFPAGTVHVAVVEAGGDSGRPGLVVELDGHAFVGPDNGLLARLAEREGARVHAIDGATLKRLGIERPSATFRGRDAQAPVAGALAAGTLQPKEVGPRSSDWAPSLLERPDVRPDQVSGVVVTVDGFGNIITNIDAELMTPLTPPEVTVAGRSLVVRRSYADGSPGEVFALVNAFGVVEIARAQKSAADHLGVGRGAPVIIRRRFHRD